MRRVVLTQTEELSATGRRLLKSVRQKADGSIEVHVHDQPNQLTATRRLCVGFVPIFDKLQNRIPVKRPEERANLAELILQLAALQAIARPPSRSYGRLCRN